MVTGDIFKIICILGLCTTVMTVAKRVCTKKDKRKATHGRNAYKISTGTKFNTDQLLRKVIVA